MPSLRAEKNKKMGIGELADTLNIIIDWQT